ncbi:MAG: hypothetical protein ACUZ8I_16700 [Candidatus Scalindua sp.]
MSQAQLIVNLDDPVYSILEVSDIRGVINKLLAVKPYNQNRVEDHLSRLLTRGDFSAQEKVIINEAYREYSDKPADFNIGVSECSELRLDLANYNYLHSLNRVFTEFTGGLSAKFSYIEAIEGRIKPAPWVDFSFLTVNMGDWSDPIPEQKMLSIHRIEIFPCSWLYLSAWESAVWAKRFELSYINPAMLYYVDQNISGDFDNIAIGGNFAVIASLYFRYYFSLFIDEFINDSWDRFFKTTNNQYAWQTGLKIPLSGLPFSLLTLQYTKIEPYCYTHYLQDHPSYSQ